MTNLIIPRVVVKGDTVDAHLAGNPEPKRFELQSLPEKYIEWIDQGRRGMYSSILTGRPGNVRFFSQHLPVVVTYSKDNAFPFNCGNKGVGFMPKEEHLPEFIELLEATHDRTRNRPWRESLAQRIETMSRFYFDHDKIDYRAVTSLEIFERTTFGNLCETPLASLLYTGECPDYTSFQLNCVAEIIGPDDPRHRFAVLSRTMFEFDRFHIAQSRFPYAYIFWIAEIRDKTPFQVPDRRPETAGGVPWRDDAKQAVGRAPTMIQEFIRESVEDYAGRRGFTEITMEVLQEAKANLAQTGDISRRAARPGTDRDESEV